jgi:6-pyruvoyltetrahydropterin/6-carboxytetrahydropterin synthase
MSNRYVSTKVIPLGSCAFRQPLAESHCRFIHGYRLQAKFWFTCSSLDSNNWVVDFGALKGAKTILEDTFDHKTVVSDVDPDLDMFRELEKRKIVDLVIMEGGVGIEKFAQFCFKTINEYIDKVTFGRCWVQKVEVWEHEGNSAIYEKTSPDNVWKS